MWIIVAVFLLVALVFPTPGRRRRGRAPFRHTGPQWRRAYSRRSFLRLGAMAAAAAVLAYSGADRQIEQLHTGRVRNRVSDHVSEIFKLWGERFWFIVWALTTAVDSCVRTTAFSRWGRRNFEAMCVGLPTLWTLQRVGGADRPTSRWGRPEWRPFSREGADKTASGHTFIAAIPFITLARSSSSRASRVAAWGASPLTGWSRINDRKHYLSQVLFGYGIAWNAVDSVIDRETLENVGDDVD